MPRCRFYLVDEDFGPLFIKFCSYFPFNAKLCINGHEYLKRLARCGIAFEALDNDSQDVATAITNPTKANSKANVGSGSISGLSNENIAARIAPTNMPQSTITSTFLLFPERGELEFIGRNRRHTRQGRRLEGGDAEACRLRNPGASRSGRGTLVER